MPKILTRSLVLLILLAMFPPLLVALARSKNSNEPRIHIIQDMDNQHRFRAQHVNEMFADSRAMRTHVPGTISRGDLKEDGHFYRGLVNGTWATAFPPQVPMSAETLARGRDRFNIYCAPCHGESGNGLGIVHIRAQELMNAGNANWVQPTAVFDPTVIDQPPGQLFNTITYGVRNMPAYGPQIPEADRWAIVAWIEALQRSQVANWSDVPQAERPSVEQMRQEQIEDAQKAAAEAERQRQQQQRNNAGSGGGQS